MSLNSYWIQKYQPSKLNVKKNICFSTEGDKPLHTLGLFRSKMVFLKGVAEGKSAATPLFY